MKDNIRTSTETVMIRAYKGTRYKLKVIASTNGITMNEAVEMLIKHYEATSK